MSSVETQRLGMVTVTREGGEWRMCAVWEGDATPIAEATTTALDPSDDADLFMTTLPEGLWDAEFERIPGEDDD